MLRQQNHCCRNQTPVHNKFWRKCQPSGPVRTERRKQHWKGLKVGTVLPHRAHPPPPNSSFCFFFELYRGLGPLAIGDPCLTCPKSCCSAPKKYLMTLQNGIFLIWIRKGRRNLENDHEVFNQKIKGLIQRAILWVSLDWPHKPLSRVVSTPGRLVL